MVATGLAFPEGPVALPNGDVIVAEIAGGCLTRIDPAGGKSTVSRMGGGPNGAALGPDGKVYICNNGGHVWTKGANGVWRAGGPSPDYQGGWIERVDLRTGTCEVLYRHADAVPLTAPNDLVFDRQGGLWFTDLGQGHDRHIVRGGVLYAEADGSRVREVIFPILRPNGIALSSDETKLYVAETDTCRLWVFDVVSPGRIEPVAGSPNGGRFFGAIPGWRMFDSMAVDSEGNVCVATRVQGAISVFSSTGVLIREIPMPDPHTTNICFGGPDLRTAFVTLGDRGELVAFPWHCPGLRLNFWDRVEASYAG